MIPHYEPGQRLFKGIGKTEVLAWIEALGDPKRANLLVKVIHPSGEVEIKVLTVNKERELVLIDQLKHHRSWKPC
ncbi:hypothetical protein AUR04nite_34860 [Glutamicibacter uratoxydans]|uniref:Uncharacterized protein n=1 Tax=Glutamicibacter uratoxydans TaxID=43667 RepID=A0A4Y4DVT3_GLUUR|nr:hypothetical protein [Glutamicibacter uratoxydans]GED07954.1 hypothetical protein AUR04nite_34860 [Glutamicibacter uratoxydans]